MYDLNIELMRLISERLNLGESKPNYELMIKRKDQKGGFEIAPYKMQNVISMSVDRRYNMAADELKVTFDDTNGLLSPDYSTNKEYQKVEGLPLSGYNQVIMPFNEISVDFGYGNELRRMFTGHISEISISESQKSISIQCKNTFRKLLKPIDPMDKKALLYENKTAVDIIIDLLIRAGCLENEYLIDADLIDDKLFTIPNLKFELGTFYSDAIQGILDIMNHRIYADRYGMLVIKKIEIYSQRQFHVWDIDDYINMSEGEYKIEPQYIRNRVIIQAKNGWQAFEDPYLKSYCNQEILSCGLPILWAENEEQMWAAADKFFLDMRRKLRRISIVTKGNPSFEIGDLVRVKGLISTANAKYIIMGIQSNFNSSGYVDQIELEYTLTSEGHLCEKAQGNYADVESNLDGEVSQPMETTKRNEIVKAALSWEGTLYQWDGDMAHNEEDYGMDCSHFIYTVLKSYNLQNEFVDGKTMYTLCESITEEQIQEGDLVFYSTSEQPEDISHIGMYVGNGGVISAIGRCNITTPGVARALNKGIVVHPLSWITGNRFYGKVNGM